VPNLDNGSNFMVVISTTYGSKIFSACESQPFRKPNNQICYGQVAFGKSDKAANK
jgi:hypothetical protein